MNSERKKKFRKYSEKVKYLISPIIYKILYDKYRRPEIYLQIRNQLILGHTNKELVKIMKNNFSYETNLHILQMNNFPEVLILSYYDELFNHLSFIFGLGLVALGQYSIFKISDRQQWDKKKFVFLDNNRVIFNKILGLNSSFVGITKVCTYLTLTSMVYFIGLYFHRRMFFKIEEEKFVLNNYNRSIILYNNLLK